jgi:Uma2 family endonuclease
VRPESDRTDRWQPVGEPRAEQTPSAPRLPAHRRTVRTSRRSRAPGAAGRQSAARGGRIVQPDIVVADTDDLGTTVEARLAVEVVSPGSAGTDRLLKPQLYAAAGIGWYLRVDQSEDSVELHPHRLTDGCYGPAEVAGPGQTLASDESFPFAIDVASLMRRRRG